MIWRPNNTLLGDWVRLLIEVINRSQTHVQLRRLANGVSSLAANDANSMSPLGCLLRRSAAGSSKSTNNGGVVLRFFAALKQRRIVDRTPTLAHPMQLLANTV